MSERSAEIGRESGAERAGRSWLAGTGRVFSVLASVLLCLGVSVAAAGVVEALPANAPVPAVTLAGGGCGTTKVCVSLPCKHKGHCPTVVATPTRDLGTDQWVYLTLSNFPPDDVAAVSYCTDTKSLGGKGGPLCDAISTPSLPDPQQQLPIFPNGSAVTSVHVELDPPTPGNVPFSGVVPGTIPPVSGQFFCDNGPQKCAIEITDSSLGAAGSTPTAANTAVVPVEFRSQSQGCPGAQFVFTSSDFSVEQLFPHESSFACTSANPVVAVDTASDSAQALTSLLSGSTNLAFITNPLSPEVQQLLEVAHGKYALIPVAASAVVIGYEATMQQGVGSFYGFNSLRLTPSQVAGLITYNYASPYGSDLGHCPAKLTTELNQVPSPAGPCPLIQALNAVPGYTPATSYGVFLPAYRSGVTRELINWICSAPDNPVFVDGYSIRDPNLAEHELTTSDFDTRWPIRNCSSFDQFPAVPSPNSAEYALLNSPAVQGKFLRQFLPPPQFENHPAGAFAPVDWSEARYLGLETAALQNAGGYFVAPTAGSVEEALRIAKIAPGGVLEPSYTARSKTAYPMPEVTYAVVPTSKLTAATAANTRDLLDELLTFTGGGEVAHLPDGYVPLPSWLYKKALADVQNEVVAEPTNPQGGGTTTTTTTTTTVPVTTTTTVPFVTTTTDAPPATTTTTTPVVHPHAPPPPHRSKSGKPARHHRRPAPPPAVHYAPVLLAGSGARFALPLIVGGGGLSLIPGSLLLARRRARRRETATSDA